jgi:site-specific DNA-methyltransferase (adenine-specific)
MGCEGLEPKQVNDGRKDQTSINCPQQRGITYRQNSHPTVKPLKLMEYLCTLTKTPTGGIVLDPFLGSGTTAMAAIKTGRNFIGIEKEPEYVKIAEARIKSVQVQQSLFV